MRSDPEYFADDISSDGGSYKTEESDPKARKDTAAASELDGSESESVDSATDSDDDDEDDDDGAFDRAVVSDGE